MVPTRKICRLRCRRDTKRKELTVQGTHPGQLILKPICNFQFLSPEGFGTCIKRRLLSQGQSGAACPPITRAALYEDDLLAVTAHQGLQLTRREFNNLAGGVTARWPSCYPGRYSTSSGGRRHERTKHYRGRKERASMLSVCPLGNTAMPGTLNELPVMGMALVVHCSCD